VHMQLWQASSPCQLKRLSPEELSRSASMSVCKAVGLPGQATLTTVHAVALARHIWWQTITRSATIIQKPCQYKHTGKSCITEKKSPGAWKAGSNASWLTRTHVIPTTGVSWGWADATASPSSQAPSPCSKHCKVEHLTAALLSSLALLHCNRGSNPAPGPYSCCHVNVRSHGAAQ